LFLDAYGVTFDGLVEVLEDSFMLLWVGMSHFEASELVFKQVCRRKEWLVWITTDVAKAVAVASVVSDKLGHGSSAICSRLCWLVEHESVSCIIVDSQ
jgi:hypothetical protein